MGDIKVYVGVGFEVAKWPHLTRSNKMKNGE